LIPLFDILLAHINLFALSMIRYDVAGLLLLGGGVVITAAPAWLRGLPYGKILLLGMVRDGGVALLYARHRLFGAAPRSSSTPRRRSFPPSSPPSSIDAFEKGTGIAFLLAALGRRPSSLGGSEGASSNPMSVAASSPLIAAICWAWYSINGRAGRRGLTAQLHGSHLSAAGIGVTVVFLVAAGFGAARCRRTCPGLPRPPRLITLGSDDHRRGLPGTLASPPRRHPRDALPQPSAVLGMITGGRHRRPPTAMQLVGGGIVIVGLRSCSCAGCAALPQRKRGPPAAVLHHRPATSRGREGDT